MSERTNASVAASSSFFGRGPVDSAQFNSIQVSQLFISINHRRTNKN